MVDFTDHNTVVMLLTQTQDDETDQREDVRNSDLFINKKDGQWEPDIISKWRNKPRYTIDHTSVAINRAAGEINKQNFETHVRPAGGGASKESAEIFEGIVRMVKAKSRFSHIRKAATKNLITGGIAGWEIVQDWIDADSFDQDLMIRPLSEFENRVWYDPDSELQDKSDAKFLFVLQSLTPEAYKARWPKGNAQSLSTDRQVDAYTYKPEMIWVGRFLYRVEETRELVMMSNGAVYERDEKFESVVDELAQRGVTIAKDEDGNERVRKRKSPCFYSRLFDAGGWLNAPQKTVFALPPVIPVYGNYKITEGKVTYHGEVRRMMDPARLYNYTVSKKFAEVALSPKGKFWMTRKQAEGEESTLRTLNTNSDPVQFYTPDPESGIAGPPPFIGGAQPNSGLLEASQSILNDLQQISGQTGVSGGMAQGQLSEASILSLQDRVDVATSHYADSVEIAMYATDRVLIDAIPKVYDSRREVMILDEAGEEEMVTLYDEIFDRDANKVVMLNDLSKGIYDVVVAPGRDYKTRQQEAVTLLQEAAAAIPGVGELSADILFRSINAPGTEVVAERIRARMIQSGLIPFDQLTEEEQQAAQQAAQQPQEPTPEDKIADAEIGRVQAETADIISKSQERERKLILEEQKMILGANEAARKQEAEDVKQLLGAMQKNFDNQMTMIQTLAEALKDTREAIGATTIVGPQNIAAYDATASNLTTANRDLQLPDQGL